MKKPDESALVLINNSLKKTKTIFLMDTNYVIQSLKPGDKLKNCTSKPRVFHFEIKSRTENNQRPFFYSIIFKERNDSRKDMIILQTIELINQVYSLFVLVLMNIFFNLNILVDL